jgi:ADP-heptose:LPS heptosyltransferase
LGNVPIPLKLFSVQVSPRLEQVTRRADEVRTPGDLIPGVERLAVVRHDRLGDFVLTLPAIDALRRTYSAARLALVVAPWIRPLAERVEGVDRVLETGPDSGGLGERLASFRADLIVCISRGAPFALTAARGGVRHRVGTGFRFYSPLFTRRVDERRRASGRHELEYALSYAHRVGATAGPARFPLGLDPAADEKVRTWLAAHEIGDRFVVIHPGSGGSCPRWPLEHFRTLVERLLTERVDLVLSVGPSDEEVADAVSTGATRVGRLPVFTGPLSEIQALTKRAALVVSNSTGPIHLAAAQATPSLAIHAPWSSCGVSRWGPYDERGWGLVADAPGAAEWTRTERRRNAGALMAGLSPELVQRCTHAILEGRTPL